MKFRRYILTCWVMVISGNRLMAQQPGSGNTAFEINNICMAGPFYSTWWFTSLLLLTISFSWYTYFRSRLNKQQQILMLETKAQVLEKEKAMIMYESLKQQLNPHFLFNSLTSLSGLIHCSPDKASDFLDGLSKIYRYILKSRHHDTVPINEEINFVRSFARLQQTRFSKGLEINIDVEKDGEHCEIPPVTLQNLIENAIKHNIIDEESPLVIDLYIEGIYIVVRNNLQRKKFVATSNRQGLISLCSLYGYLTDEKVLIIEDENYFTVKVPRI